MDIDCYEKLKIKTNLINKKNYKMMNGDSCMMEKTFFADKPEFKKGANFNPKDETKNSSNPEIVLKEYLLISIKLYYNYS